MRSHRRLLALLTQTFRFARTYGFAKAGYRLFGSVIEASGLHNVFCVCIFDILAAPVAGLKSFPTLPRAFCVRKALPTEISALQAFFGKPMKVSDRLDRGDTCFLLLSEGKIYAAEWVASGARDYRDDWQRLHCVFRFPAGVCWLYDGKGDGASLGPWGMLMASLPQHFTELGISEVYLAIDYGNAWSLTNHETLGYQMVSRICHIRIGRFSRCLYRPSRQNWRQIPGQVGLLELSEA